ncbi:MAG: hypothetical protein DRP93_07540, partial [Candidatus Neomarinimicrobiota bacterium]
AFGAAAFFSSAQPLKKIVLNSAAKKRTLAVGNIINLVYLIIIDFNLKKVIGTSRNPHLNIWIFFIKQMTFFDYLQGYATVLQQNCGNNG